MVIYSGFSHEKWWFSIAMLVYQRVTHPQFMLASMYDRHPTPEIGPIWTLRDLTCSTCSRLEATRIFSSPVSCGGINSSLWYPKSSPNASISRLNPTCMQTKFTFQEVNSLNEIILMCMYNCIISTLVLTPRVPSARTSHTAFPSSRVAAVLIFHQKLMSFVAILILW